MICNCCAVSPLLENFTFVSPPKTDLQVVIKCSGVVLFNDELMLVMFGLSVLIVNIVEFGVALGVFSFGWELLLEVGIKLILLLLAS